MVPKKGDLTTFLAISPYCMMTRFTRVAEVMGLTGVMWETRVTTEASKEAEDKEEKKKKEEEDEMEMMSPWRDKQINNNNER